MGFKGRATFLRLAVGGVLLILSGRLVWLQTVRAEEIIQRGEEMRLSKQAHPAVRGRILDRNGRPLAVTVPVHSVVANPKRMADAQEPKIAALLAPVLGIPPDEILAKIRSSPEAGYLPLKGELTLEQAKVVKALKIDDLPIDGITVEEKLEREYPQKFVANHILGYLKKDEKGQYVGEYGLEARYDKELRGQPGEVLAELTQGNTPIEGTVKKAIPPVPGKDLVLTIDVALHQQVEAKLEAVVKELEAKRALVIAMNAHTGEILVMAMRPGADPGDRNTWGNPVDFGRITNWAVTPMSPGSIFKVITTAAALEERAITLNSTFVDPGKLVIDGWSIQNWDFSKSTKPETPTELMMRSSNVGLVMIGQKLGEQNFLKYVKGFGFMETTGIDLSAEHGSNGLTNFEQKADIDWANMYIGQHLEVTPIQMITAVAAIANGGKLVQPHLVREIRDAEGKVVQATPVKPSRQVISEATAKEMQKLLVDVVQKGTASLAVVPGYSVGGKTGTAQKPSETGGLKKNLYLADFVGFAPANNPEIVMLVMVDEPAKGQGYGGLVAAPIFRDLLPHVMQAVGIGPDTPAALGQEKAPPKVVAGVVPNLLWLPLDRAQARLAEAGFQAKLTGSGALVGAQAIQPGSTARKGTVVELTLSPKDTPDGKVRVPDFTGLSLAEASQMAADVGLTLKAGGAGFVADQEPKAGSAVPARSALSVRLAPAR